VRANDLELMKLSTKSHKRKQLASSEQEFQRQNRFVGLINEGTTCYANSLLQALFALGEFRARVFQAQTQDQANEILLCV
jgi:ubiquitin carboxyl-terminal hydrolase 7